MYVADVTWGPLSKFCETWTLIDILFFIVKLEFKSLSICMHTYLVFIEKWMDIYVEKLRNSMCKLQLTHGVCIPQPMYTFI